MSYLHALFGVINDLTWGFALVPILIVFGIFLTLMTNGVQFQFFRRMFGVLFDGRKPAGKHAISARQALLVSLGGRVGGGNIAGVAVAITLGGPGAVFWMWACAVIGMATSLVECTLAQLYKRAEGNGEFRGGPAEYIRRGLGMRFQWLSVVYAICLLMAFGIGFPSFQGNTMAGALYDSFGTSRVISGLVLAAITGLIVYGGIHRIAKASDVVVPVMAGLYIITGLIVIAMHIDMIPQVFGEIFRSAFGLDQGIAGGIGAAISQGARRGLFSNEAGLGSAPNVAAVAHVPHPVTQGVTQSLSVFIDTIVVCSATAFIILLAPIYHPGITGIDGIALTQQSLATHFGEWARYVMTGAVLLFAFSSIIYDYYLGENAMTILTESKIGLHAIRILVMVIVFAGCVAPDATSVFFFADPMMGLLAIVNLMAVVMLFPTALRVIDDYRAQIRAGRSEPVFTRQGFADLDLDPQVWPEKEN